MEAKGATWLTTVYRRTRQTANACAQTLFDMEAIAPKIGVTGYLLKAASGRSK